MENRDEWLARTFVELADTLVADFDLIDFLSVLADACVELLATAEVALALTDLDRHLQVMVTSSEPIGVLETLEFEIEEGPSLECYRQAGPVLNRRLAECGRDWGRFAPAALRAGFQVVHALPLHLRGDTIGVMSVFDTRARLLSVSEVTVAQALADVATIGILQERTIKQRTDLSLQLQGALDSRIVIEQAKGIVVERLQVPMVDAFALLRAYARSHQAQLADVASAVIDGSLSAEALGPRRSPSVREARGKGSTLSPP